MKGRAALARDKVVYARFAERYGVISDFTVCGNNTLAPAEALWSRILRSSPLAVTEHRNRLVLWRALPRNPISLARAEYGKRLRGRDRSPRGDHRIIFCGLKAWFAILELLGHASVTVRRTVAESGSLAAAGKL